MLFDAYSHFYGQDDPEVLVVHAGTTTMNPTANAAAIQAEIDADFAKNCAEYRSQFRDDVSGFVPLDVVRACVDSGVRERPPIMGARYFAHVDPSGGSKDPMTLCIGHREGENGRVVIDVIREVQPQFSLDDVVRDFSNLMKRYGVTRCTGDHYAGQWVVSAFNKEHVEYKHSEKTTSELFGELLPQLNTRGVLLLDNKRAIDQITSLQRKISPGGRDIISHIDRSWAHDDVACVVAGVCFMASGIGGRRGGGGQGRVLNQDMMGPSAVRYSGHAPAPFVRGARIFTNGRGETTVTGYSTYNSEIERAKRKKNAPR